MQSEPMCAHTRASRPHRAEKEVSAKRNGTSTQFGHVRGHGSCFFCHFCHAEIQRNRKYAPFVERRVQSRRCYSNGCTKRGRLVRRNVSSIVKCATEATLLRTFKSLHLRGITFTCCKILFRHPLRSTVSYLSRNKCISFRRGNLKSELSSVQLKIYHYWESLSSALIDLPFRHHRLNPIRRFVICDSTLDRNNGDY